MNIRRYIAIFFLLIFSYIEAANANANSNVVFIDIDFLIQESISGKKILKKIDEKNKEQTLIFKERENKIKKRENEIKKKRNILSEQEFMKEIDSLKADINIFNNEKKKAVKELNNFKVKEINLLLSSFNNIIKDYMDQNSIEIVINKKNLYIGKVSSDITKEILNKINQKN